MLQKIKDASVYDVCNKMFFVSGLIIFVMALTVILINLILSQTLVIPFYDLSPFLSLGLLIIHVWWVFSLFSYVMKKKT
jgi:hypothetical protein